MAEINYKSYTVFCNNNECEAFNEIIEIHGVAPDGTVYCGACNLEIVDKTEVAE